VSRMARERRMVITYLRASVLQESRAVMTVRHPIR
jgi:hypothetical protein